MMIVMKETATSEEVEAVVDKIERAGALAHPIEGARLTVIGAIGDVEQDVNIESLGLEGQPGVDRVRADPQALQARLRADPPRRAHRARHRRAQDRRRSLRTDRRSLHGRIARADARRPRAWCATRACRCCAAAPTSHAPPPTPSRGSASEGLRLLAEAKAETGLPIVTELMDLRDLDPVLEVADVIQIGARNMQNYPLLTEIGRSGCPALLKRGLSSTLDELLMAAEYILKEGNPNVMLCERGIRTFETDHRRTTLDIMAVPILKELSHLPVIVDPSHAAGRRDLVLPLSLAAAAAGADGIIVEVHPNPDEAVCDGPQALLADTFDEYAAAVQRTAEFAGKALSAV